MLYPILAVVIGLIGLVWSADRFVEGAAATAWRAGMSKLLIGMTIVSVGTSAPEIVVSIMASLDGTPDIATGNALGSNIANIGLVLGVTALIAPIPVHFGLVRRELPLLLFADVRDAAGDLLSHLAAQRHDRDPGSTPPPGALQPVPGTVLAFPSWAPCYLQLPAQLPARDADTCSDAGRSRGLVVAFSLVEQ